MQACAKDMGILIGASVYADASAALGIIKRRGIGKLRHIRTQSLWLQEAHATKRLSFEKIDGSRNPSDLLTKHLSEILMDRHMKVIGALPEDGRASTAPTLASLGINEQPLLGYDIPEGAQDSSNTHSRTTTADGKKQSRPTGARAGSPSPDAHYLLTCVGDGSDSGATSRIASSPYICAAKFASRGGKDTTSSCLGEPAKAAQETSSCTMQEMTVECPVTPPLLRSGCNRCVDGVVDVLSSGHALPRKHAQPHGSVCGSSLKPTREVSQVYANNDYKYTLPHVISRCSEKPKVPVRRDAESQKSDTAIPRAIRRQPSNPPRGASGRGIEEDDLGRYFGGGDAAAANVRIAPQGVRTANHIITERAAGLSAPHIKSIKSALRSSHRLGFKSAWDDSDEELDVSIIEGWMNWKGRSLTVGFDEKVAIHFVTAYSEIYGQHPSTFNFAHDGTKLFITSPESYKAATRRKARIIE